MIAGSRFLTPHFLWRLPIFPYPLPFQILSNVPNHLNSFCSFVALVECVDLNFLSLGTVIPAVPCVLYATEHQIYWRSDIFCIFDRWYFLHFWQFLLVLWFEITHANTHRTQMDQYTDAYLQIHINTNCYIHTVATCITLNKYVTDTKTYFTEVYNVSAFQKLLTCGSHISAD